MSRLTAYEIEQIVRAKSAAVRFNRPADHWVAEGRRLQSETVSRIVGQALSTAARKSGLNLFAEIVIEDITRPLVAAYRERRASAELAELNDHILADIGLTRSDLPRVVHELAIVKHVERSPLRRIARRIRHARVRRETIQRLRDLDDRMLEDIGILRGNIEAHVDRLLSEAAEHEGNGLPVPAETLHPRVLAELGATARKAAAQCEAANDDLRKVA